MTREDAFWLKHDLKMDALWDRVFGPDEPAGPSPPRPMQDVSDRVRTYLHLKDDLWTEIRETVLE